MVEGEAGATMLFYKMFLPEKAFDENTYFDGLRKMLTLENIKENAVEVSLFAGNLFRNKYVR